MPNQFGPKKNLFILGYKQEHFYRLRSTNHFQFQIRQKKQLFLLLLGTFSFLVFLFLITAFNIRYANGQKYTFRDLYYLMITNNIFANHLNRLKGLYESSGIAFDANNFIDLQPIRQALWSSLATALAGIGLAIAGATTQGLTHNPISDPTTFGITEASIFGAVLMNFLVGSSVSSAWYSYIFFFFAFLGGLFSVIFILLLINTNNKRPISYLHITLAGLALAIFFRMANYILRSTDVDAAKTAFAMVIGGAENIFQLYSSQFQVLTLAIVLILLCFLGALIFARNLTILELGDQQARSLGINTQFVKTVGLLLILISVPAAVVLVGNVAFVGLFAPHIIRILFKTRNYQVIFPLAALLGAITTSLGLTMNHLFSSIPSSIYTMFIGAPMLIYLGWTK